ncbi:D-tagatose-bisphosphate aldolase, class II, non-catalytic subunit [Xanthomonas sp. Kuri4-1]
MSPLQTLLASHRAGHNVGLYSVCCSHEQVLRAALAVARAHGTVLLVEATSNQVDQFGGYTGMTPPEYRDYVGALADEAGFPRERLILGGDHLGPNAWQKRPAAEAMAQARVLIEAYVAAGFHKIHLDCSMSCADDPVPLPDALVAARSAELATIAERTAAEHGRPPPLYVIGTEVPVPGGEASLAGGLRVTTPDAAAQTLAIHRQAFDTPPLREAWQRVIALVVQPGVDFDHSHVHEYDPAAAAELADFLERQPRIVFEAHSTDYQRESGLHALVRDHFAILKVGPAATFAYREALFALAAIEAELFPAAQCSRLPEVLEAAMLARPDAWQAHYHGDADTLRRLRRHAFSDRCRYYWGEPALVAAVQTLFANLERHAPPLALLSQYLPEQYRAVREGTLANTPAALVQHRIGLCLGEYARACSANRAGTRKQNASSAASVLANG